jgi:hypothetical protein
MIGLQRVREQKSSWCHEGRVPVFFCKCMQCQFYPGSYAWRCLFVCLFVCLGRIMLRRRFAGRSNPKRRATTMHRYQVQMHAVCPNLHACSNFENNDFAHRVRAPACRTLLRRVRVPKERFGPRDLFAPFGTLRSVCVCCGSTSGGKKIASAKIQKMFVVQMVLRHAKVGKQTRKKWPDSGC